MSFVIFLCFYYIWFLPHPSPISLLPPPPLKTHTHIPPTHRTKKVLIPPVRFTKSFNILQSRTKLVETLTVLGLPCGVILCSLLSIHNCRPPLPPHFKVVPIQFTRPLGIILMHVQHCTRGRGGEACYIKLYVL